MNFDDKVTLLNIANSVADTGSNFIPAGTVITVELDGSGDFTSLHEALNYIVGKYSNGEVTIKLGKGTFVEPRTLIDTSLFNFSQLIITGTTREETIIYTTDWTDKFQTMLAISNYGTPVFVKSCTLKGIRDDNNLSNSAFWVEAGARCKLDDVLTEDVSKGIMSYTSGYIIIMDIYVNNVEAALFCQGATIINIMGCSITCNNVNTICFVNEGGIIRLCRYGFNKTNVYNEFSKSVNVMDSNGIIMRG